MKEKNLGVIMNTIINTKKLALIEANKLQILDQETNWSPIEIEGLDYIPVAIYPSAIKKNENEITYRIQYELILGRIRIECSNIEECKIEFDKDGNYNCNYYIIPNEDEEINSPIKYNNDRIYNYNQIGLRDMIKYLVSKKEQFNTLEKQYKKRSTMKNRKAKILKK